MSKLRNMLRRLTGLEIDYRKAPKYIAINLSYNLYADVGRINDYVLFDSPEDFQLWLEENIARIDQEDWKLYEPIPKEALQ
jgi:hypothetical protein